MGICVSVRSVLHLPRSKVALGADQCSVVLDVTNGSTANGVKMQIWACTPGAGDAAQHFTVTSANQIEWANTAECLDLTDGSLTSGNQVRISFFLGNSTPSWEPMLIDLWCRSRCGHA
jgi:hypothetical protein